MLFMDNRATTALDVNGFPVDLGDLVEATRDIKEAEGLQGIVAGVHAGGMLQVQMEKKIRESSPEPERVLSNSICWKVIAKGVLD